MTYMKLDSEHVLFWMDAIRNSSKRDRTLESFWKGQLRSKIWLINNLKSFIDESVTIDIFGGWNGVLASLLFQSDIPIESIRNIDIDPECREIANTMNALEVMNNRFEHIISDMVDIDTCADIAINTSCEHLTQQHFDKWLDKLSINTLIVLQSNDYTIDEHVRIATSLEDFIQQSSIEVLLSDELKLPLYTRFMLIGRKR